MSSESSDEVSKLRERIDALEEEVAKRNKMGTTRRALLSGSVGLLGLAGLSGSATAADTAGQTGTFGDGNQDWDVQDVDATTVDTALLSGDYPQQLYAYADGSVVASVDPANTTTPLADATAAINNNGGTGTIQLPPTRITEAATIGSEILDIDIIGYGIHTSIVEFNDLSNDAFHFQSAELSKSRWDGFTISGSDAGNRTGGSAIHWDAETEGFNLGNIRFAEWIDKTIWFDSSHPFGSNWDYVTFTGGAGTGTNFGRNLVADSSALLIDIGVFQGNNQDQSTIIDINSDVHINISQFDVTGDPGKAVDASITPNGSLQIGQIHYETNSADTTRSGAMVTLTNNGDVNIGYIEDNNVTFDYIVELTFHPGNNRIGTINLSDSAGVNNNLINLVDAPDRDANYYGGPVSDIDNSANSKLGQMWSLKQGQVADPLTTTVTHTTGGATRDGISGTYSLETDAPKIQRIVPSTTGQVTADWSVNADAVWNDSYGWFDVRLEWVIDPGADMDFDVELIPENVGIGG
jgi:hypothetical protein